MKLRFTVYRVADAGLRAGWNRYRRDRPYPTKTMIGAYFVAWRWCWSLLWRTP